jgi:hypothetical protein
MADEESNDKPRRRVYYRLLEDLADGNVPGSPLTLGASGDQTVWLHTAENIRAWLLACLNDGVGALDE